jgi:hypothetical protein
MIYCKHTGPAYDSEIQYAVPEFIDDGRVKTVSE